MTPDFWKIMDVLTARCQWWAMKIESGDTMWILCGAGTCWAIPCVCTRRWGCALVGRDHWGMLCSAGRNLVTSCSSVTRYFFFQDIIPTYTFPKWLWEGFYCWMASLSLRVLLFSIGWQSPTGYLSLSRRELSAASEVPHLCSSHTWNSAALFSIALLLCLALRRWLRLPQKVHV